MQFFACLTVIVALGILVLRVSAVAASDGVERAACPPSASISALAFVTDPIGVAVAPGTRENGALGPRWLLRLPESGGTIIRVNGSLIEPEPSGAGVRPWAWPGALPGDTITVIYTEN